MNKPVLKGTKSKKGKNTNKTCRKKCQKMFTEKVKKTKKYKTAKLFFSALGVDFEKEMENTMNDEKVLNDPVFKDCEKGCKNKAK